MSDAPQLTEMPDTSKLTDMPDTSKLTDMPDTPESDIPAATVTKKKVLPEYTRAEVKAHNTLEDCWIIYRKKVYHFPREFIEEIHPGGPIMMDVAGADGSNMFDDGPHGESSREIIGDFLIGTVKDE